MAEVVILDSESEDKALAIVDYDSDDSENDNKYTSENFDDNFFTKIAAIEHDLIINILRQLDSLSLFKLELTCKSLKSIVEQSNIWRRQYDQLLPEFSPVEKAQNISLRVDDQSELTSYRRSLLKFHNLVTNLRTGRCKKSKLSCDQLLGFNGDSSEIKTMDANSLLMIEEDVFDRAQGKVYQIRTGETVIVHFTQHHSFQVLHSCIEDSSMVVQMVPHIDVSDVSILEYYSYDDPSSSYNLKARSELIAGDISESIKITLYKQTISIPVYSDDNTKIKIHKYSINGELIEEAGVITLVLPQIRNPDVRFEILMKSRHFFWYSISKMCVWQIDQSSFSNLELLPVWSKDKFSMSKVRIPATTVTSFDLCYPHLLVGGRDGRCQVWNCKSDTLVRMLEHDIDSYHHVGWRQVSVSDSAHIIVSLTEGGWLIGWDKPKCLLSDKSVPSKSLRLWTIDTKHESVSFVMNSSRLVTLGQHRTSDWDFRSYMVVRDFWKYVAIHSSAQKRKGKTPKKKKKRSKRI